MTLRLLRFLACQLLLVFACAQARAADGVEIVTAHIEATDEGYKLSAAYAFDLNAGLEDAIKHGVKLYFTTELELTRPRWYWTDERAVSARQTARISYDIYLRQYNVYFEGSVRQTFATLEDALFLIRRPSRWVVAPRGALEAGKTYNVSMRMFMDRELLPKPIQVNAFNNAEWRLSSNKKTFSYKAE